MSARGPAPDAPVGASCEAVQDLLAACAQGESTPDERAAVEAHLASCASCREESQGLRETLRMARSLPSLSPRPETWMRVRMQTTAEAQAMAGRGIPRAAWLWALFLLPVAAVAARIVWTLLAR